MGKGKEALKRVANWEPRPDSKLDAHLKNVRALLVIGLLGLVASGVYSVNSKIEEAKSTEMCEGDISKIFDDFSAINAKGLKAEREDLPLGLRLEARKFQRQVLDMISSGVCRIQGEHVIVEIEGLPPYRINLEDLAEYMCKGLCVTDQDFILRRLGLAGLGLATVGGVAGGGYLAKKGLGKYRDYQRIQREGPRVIVIGEDKKVVDPEVVGYTPKSDAELVVEAVLRGEIDPLKLRDLAIKHKEAGQVKKAQEIVEILTQVRERKRREKAESTT